MDNFEDSPNKILLYARETYLKENNTFLYKANVLESRFQMSIQEGIRNLEFSEDFVREQFKDSPLIKHVDPNSIIIKKL